MKFCNESEKCQTCEARELCQALENLINLIKSHRPAPKSDAKIKEDVEEYLIHIVPTLDEDKALELYKSLDFSAFYGLILASMHNMLDLYISWEAKCEELDKLKVQLDAQEVLQNG